MAGTRKVNYPEILADLADKLVILLNKEGLALERATDVALKAAEYVRAEWGGQHVYIGSGLNFNLARRDAEIYEKFDGHNVPALARKYRLSAIRVYQIIGAVRAKRKLAE